MKKPKPTLKPFTVIMLASAMPEPLSLAAPFSKITTNNYNAIIRQAQKTHTVSAGSTFLPLPWIALRKVVS
jgi:hypothetical protein